MRLRGGGCAGSKSTGQVVTMESVRVTETIDGAAAAFAAEAKFVALSELRTQEVLPRRGRDPNFSHPLTKQPNANLAKPYSAFDANSTVFIFCSHRWARPGKGAAGHPDDDGNHKLELIVKACDKLRGPSAPIPENFEIAVWLDFCCIDQDGAPASELEQLGELIQRCDLLLTPVIDPDHETWEVPTTYTSMIESYKAASWKEYWTRAWCRVEALLAASRPVEDRERARLFRGALAAALADGRRPQAIFGTKQVYQLRPPVFLPPMQNSVFDQYKPTKGKLTAEADRELIGKLEAVAEQSMQKVEEGYTGERNAQGKKHGRGTFKYASGNVYEGEWKDDKRNGRGTFKYADGNVYEGEFKDDERNGRGTFKHADGNVYEGEFKDDKRSGRGTAKYASGNVYEGEFKDDERNGRGTFKSADGNVYEGEWKDDKRNGRGTAKYASGNVYEGEWKDNKRNGRGTFKYGSGNVYEGEWKDDKRNGRGTAKSADGNVYEGEWKDDKFKGRLN